MTVNINVTKRSGKVEAFNPEKIKQAISWACEGLEVSPLQLECKFDQFLFDGIKTTTIQENLIEHAKAMCSPSEPDWTIVAGRLLTMNLWAETRSYEVEFLDFVKEQKRLGYWTHPAFDKYSDEEIVAIGDFMVQERDLEHSYASVTTAISKYLMPGECIQHLFLGEAMIIASVEKEENRLKFLKDIYDDFSTRTVSLATPWLSNLRCNGNISSCFIIGVDDNITSIFDNIHNAALISKAGGGLGIDISACRAAGSWLMGNEGVSTGIVGWAKIFNDVAVYVNQGGKRKGAFTVHLPIWHGDIEAFLALQTEAGDQRAKAYDIKPQVGIHDLFMELKDNSNAIWYTFCPYEVKKVLGIELQNCYGDEFRKAYHCCVQAYQDKKLKVVREYNAKELFKLLMKVQFETGMPYIAFRDRLNEFNPNSHVGYIPCVNLCTESFSVVVPDLYAHTCNLLSLVVGRVPMEDLSDLASRCTRVLDNGIELTKPPIEESYTHNQLFRTIGIGIQGYADIVARENKNFLDTRFATEVAERIQYGAVRESIKLAKERGAYPQFVGSKWQTGEMIANYKKHSVCPDLDWDELQVGIDLYGIRNSQLTSPAPNTSSSIFMDAGAGIMPVYSAFFYEDNKDGVMPVVAMHIKSNPLSYARDITKFKPWELTAVVGAMQKFVDTGISAEYIMDKNNPNLKAKWLWDTIQHAWENKNKAIYYIRTIKKGEKLVKDNDVCVGCSG